MNKVIFISLVFCLFSCHQKPNPSSSKDNQQAITKKQKNEPIEPILTLKEKWLEWVNTYDKGRRSKDGWLSLAGLYWLNEGDNTLGSHSKNQHKLPIGTPDYFGMINVSGDTVYFTSKDKRIKIDNKDIDSQILVLNKTQVSLDSYSFYIIKRERGFAVRLKNTMNSSIAKFTGTHFYPYSKLFAISAKLIKHKTPQTISIATVYDTVRENDSAGWLEFEFNGEKHRLQAISYGKGEPMSLMFADETGQETTYGAGRYLDVDWPAEGSVLTIINFNYAYNPPCAITPFATCPLPPMSNRLNFNVEAGELYSNTEEQH